MTSHRSIVVCGLAFGVLAGCSSRPPAAAASRSDAPSPAAAAPAVASAHASTAQTVAGTVLETMNAGTYTYVRVKADSREIWAAAPQFKVAVGDPVVLSLEQPMENFHSETLKRDFPLIYFVSQIGRPGETAAAAPAAPIEPSKGGITVEAIWKTREAIAGKSVTVRGRVVKFNGGILGVNWLHLQDGTGSTADRSNDITVTSNDAAQVGDVVTVTGTVAVNKDLGSGYNYPVIIEHASLSRK